MREKIKLESTAGTGHGQLNYAVFDGTQWIGNLPIQLPSSFDSVGEMGASARVYQGATIGNLASGDHLIEATFASKLRNRPYSEIFFGNILMDGVICETGKRRMPTVEKTLHLVGA